MVQQVDVDGAIHEFPDEATPEMMTAALKNEAARQQFENLTQNGVLGVPKEKLISDTLGLTKNLVLPFAQGLPIERLMSDASGLVKNLGSTAAQGIPATLNQAVAQPGQAVKNLGAGLSSIPFNLANTIMNIPQYVAGLESDRDSNFLKQYTPTVPTEKIVNATFGEPTATDTAVRRLGSILPVGIPFSSAVAEGALSGVASGAGKVLGKTDRALEANEALLGTNAESKAAELEQKAAAAQAADEANKQAIAQSKQEVGKSDADLMQYNVSNRQKAIDFLTNNNAALKNQLSEVQPKEGAVNEAQSNVLAKQEAQLKALQEAEANDADYSAAIEQSKQQTGKSNPDLMENAAKKRQLDINNMMDEASALQDQLSSTKVGENDIPQAEENLNTAQQHQQNTENMANSVDANIGQFLNQGAQHDVRAAQGLSNRVNAIENYWNTAYKTFQNNIADANFQMPKTAMEKLDYDSMSPAQLIQTFGGDAFEALKKGKMDEFIKKQKSNDLNQAQGNNPYLQTLTEVAPTITDTNAADFLAKYKDFRDRAFKLSQRLRDPRVEEVEKQKMQDALTQGRKMQGQMKEVLDTGLGEYKPEFERVNKGYSEQIYPLRDNPVVQNAHEGKLSDNIIKSLRTNQEGMPLVREIVKQDPELLRNVVGQRYFSGKAGRESIHNPNEMTREYLDEMPQLKRLLNERENANAALQQSTENAKVAQQQHADLIKRQGQSQKIETDLSELHDNIQKGNKELSALKENIDNLRNVTKNKKMSLEKKIKSEQQLSDAKAEYDDLEKRQNDAEKIEKKINTANEKIKKHSEEIPKLNKQIKNLQETLENKKITLKEFLQAKAEMKELNRQLKDASSKVDEATTGLHKYWRIAKTIYKLKRKMI